MSPISQYILQTVGRCSPSVNPERPHHMTQHLSNWYNTPAEAKTRVHKALDVKTRVHKALDVKTRVRQALDVKTRVRQALDAKTRVRQTLDAKTRVRQALESKTSVRQALDVNKCIAAYIVFTAKYNQQNNAKQTGQFLKA
jgi:hypothetical protein